MFIKKSNIYVNLNNVEQIEISDRREKGEDVVTVKFITVSGRNAMFKFRQMTAQEVEERINNQLKLSNTVFFY